MRYLIFLILSFCAFGQIDTIGTTSIGSADGIPADQPRFNLHTATSTGTITGGAVYQGTSTGTFGGKMIVYLDDGDDTPDAGDLLVAVSNETEVTNSPGWLTFTFSTSPTITSGNKYYIGIYIKPGTTTFGYTTVAGGTEWRDPAAGVYASMPANLGSFTLLTQSKAGSWYITYDTTPAAAASTDPKPGLPKIKKLNSIKGYE